MMSVKLDPDFPSHDDIRAPRHVAIIMDGNGRWAQTRGLSRTEGHRRGVEAVKRAAKFAGDHGIDYLTLFSFSSENWSRPQEEIDDLLNLLRYFIRRDLNDLSKENVRIRVIGSRQRIPGDILGMIDEAERKTAANTGLNLVVAFNYGSRDEIVRAAVRIAERIASGELCAGELSQDDFVDANESSKKFLDGLKRIDMSLLSGESHRSWTNALGELRKSSIMINKAESIEDSRMGFAVLSEALADVIMRFGGGLTQTVTQLRCPMAFSGRGGKWLQNQEEVENPYFGQAMLRCGERVEDLQSQSARTKKKVGGKPVIKNEESHSEGSHQH